MYTLYFIYLILHLFNLAKQSIEKADVVLIVVDAGKDISDNYKITFSEMVRVALQYAKQEIILVLNKVHHILYMFVSTLYSIYVYRELCVTNLTYT